MPYKCDSQIWLEYVAEKVAIARFKGMDLWNKRTDLLFKCQHRNKYIIYQSITYISNIYYNIYIYIYIYI